MPVLSLLRRLLSRHAAVDAYTHRCAHARARHVAADADSVFMMLLLPAHAERAAVYWRVCFTSLLTLLFDAAHDSLPRATRERDVAHDDDMSRWRAVSAAYTRAPSAQRAPTPLLMMPMPAPVLRHFHFR